MDSLTFVAERVRSTYEPGTPDPWWYDNLMHLLSGILLGLPLLVIGGETFAIVAYGAMVSVWEAFEYTYNIRPWDEREDWALDRAIEDTILDTIAGFTGLYLVIIFL